MSSTLSFNRKLSVSRNQHFHYWFLDGQICYSEDSQSKRELHWYATPVSFAEEHNHYRTPCCRMFLLLQAKDGFDPITREGTKPKKGANTSRATVWDPDHVEVRELYVVRGMAFEESKSDRYVWVWIDKSLEFTVLSGWREGTSKRNCCELPSPCTASHCSFPRHGRVYFIKPRGMLS